MYQLTHIYIYFIYYFIFFNLKFSLISTKKAWILTHSSNDNQLAVYDQQGLFTNDTIPGSRYGCGLYSYNNSLFIFGGMCMKETISGTKNCNDMWEYDLSLDQYRFLKGPLNMQDQLENLISNGSVFHESNYPDSKSNFMFWQDNNGSFFVFGGATMYSLSKNSVWEYSVLYNNWRQLKENHVSKKNYGVDREFDEANYPHNLCCTNIHNLNMNSSILGFGYSGVWNIEINEVWEFSTLLNSWRVLKSTRQKYTMGKYDVNRIGEFDESFFPAPRSYHASWVYKKSYFVYSGNMDRKIVDFWMMNLTIYQWKLLGMKFESTSSFVVEDYVYNYENWPGMRSMNAYWSTESLLYIYPTASIYYTDNVVWIYSIPKSSWKVQNRSGEFGSYNESQGNQFPPKRYMSTPVFHNQRLFIYGGMASTFITTSELWEFINLEEESYTCYGHKFLTDGVCSGHGTCYSQNNCICNENYGEDDCSSFKCFDIIKEDTDNVCYGQGDCLEINICECKENSGYYGKECNELITGAKFATSSIDSSIIIFYVVPKSEIASVTIECSFVLTNNYTRFLGLTSCSWSFDGDFTKYLIITPQIMSENEYEPPKNISIKSFTKPEHVIEFEIVPADDENDLILIISIAAGAASALIITIIIIAVGIFVCISCYKNAFQKKRISKFEGIDDIDILLKEQMIEDKQKNKFPKIKIDKSLFKISMNSVKLVSLLGVGGSGCNVYKATWNNHTIAYKVFKVKMLFGVDFSDFENEISIISSTRHPHILNCFGCTADLPRIGILLEFCCHGGINNYFLNNNDNQLVEIDIKIRFLKEICSGVCYLHQKEIIHRDLKCENILLNESLSCKIADFGVSKLMNDRSTHGSSGKMTKRIGTKFYMAPEVITTGKYGFKVDSFSFSIVMYEVLFQNFSPFGFDKNFAEFKMVNDNNYRPLIKENQVKKYSIPQEFIDLMKKNWSGNPQDRMEFNELVKCFEKDRKEDSDL